MNCHNPYCSNTATKKITIIIPNSSSIFEMNFCEECAKEIHKKIMKEIGQRGAEKTNKQMTKKEKTERAKKGAKKKWENYKNSL